MYDPPYQLWFIPACQLNYMKYPEHESACWQKLRDNTARFEKNPEIKNPCATKGRGPGSRSYNRE